MALYYPLSSFLILFANLLQNPEDPYIPSDVGLMDLVRSFLSASALGSTHFNANVTLKIFTELINVARKSVDKLGSQGMTKMKRVHEKDAESDWQPLSMLSKEPAATNGFHNAAEKLATTDARVCTTYVKSFPDLFHHFQSMPYSLPMLPTDFPQTQGPTSTSTFIPSIESTAATHAPAFETRTPFSTSTTLQPQPSSHLSSCNTEMPHSTSNDVPLLNAADTSMGYPERTSKMDGRELGWEAPMFSASFEWDLPNLWTSEFLDMQSFEDPQGRFR